MLLWHTYSTPIIISALTAVQAENHAFTVPVQAQPATTDDFNELEPLNPPPPYERLQSAPPTYEDAIKHGGP